MTGRTLSQELFDLLQAREEKIVLAESCTGGLVSATLATIPGVSAHLCGSLVVYREGSKRSWLGLRKSDIKKYTTESPQVARRLAVAALKVTPEADWGIAVVGHLGPNAPTDKDGLLYISVARRTKRGNIKTKETSEYTMRGHERQKRQEEAVEVALTKLARIIRQKTDSDTHADRTKKKSVA